jgi:mono/diheme cytochrome c family protein
MQKIISLTLLTASIFFLAAQQPAQTSKQRGSALYKQYCLTCHQADGSGVPRMNPPLIKTSYVSGDKKKLIKWVLQGSVEKVPIDGQTYSNNMPPQSYLTDQQVADILTYIRSSFGNKATAITVADVKAVRASIK